MATEDLNREAGSPQDPDHYERVKQSFTEWKGGMRDRIQPHEEEHLRSIEEAVIVRDSERVRHQLEMTKANSGWLYEELMKHPTISAFIRELAIFGL